MKCHLTFGPRVLALSALVGLLAGHVALAQAAFASSVAGSVHDPSGTAGTGVAVTIRNLASDKTQSAVSDASGAFLVQNLSAGSYEITAAKYGFSEGKVRVTLDGRRPFHAGLKLKLAAVDENATASASAETQKLVAAAERLEANATRMEAMESRIQRREAELKAHGTQAVGIQPVGIQQGGVRQRRRKWSRPKPARQRAPVNPPVKAQSGFYDFFR